MNNELISIIIPCFNSADTIERAVLSAKNQTYSNIEIICIDDCSSDKTIDILEALSSKTPYLTILKNSQNSGPSISRNKGISAATGTYIAFLDSDDYWHPQLLEVQLNILKKKDYVLISSKKGINLTFDKKINEKDVNIKDISFNKLLFKNYFTTSTVLIKKEVCPEFDSSQRYSEDYKLWLEILFNNHKSGIITSPDLASADKNPYGASGLSANLWLMEKYELKNYLYFLKKGKTLALFAILFSLIKYLKRLCITSIR